MSINQWRNAFNRLDRISRTRALTDAESAHLERAINEIDRLRPGKRIQAPWNKHTEDKLAALIADGMSISAAAIVLGKTRSAGVAKWIRIRARYQVAA